MRSIPRNTHSRASLESRRFLPVPGGRARSPAASAWKG